MKEGRKKSANYSPFGILTNGNSIKIGLFYIFLSFSLSTLLFNGSINESQTKKAMTIVSHDVNT